MLKIVFTNPYELRGETEKVNQLFKAGLELLHIRKPRYSKKQVKEYIQSIDEQYYDRIVLHSHYSLALELGLRGIHINKRSRVNWIFMNFMLKYYRSINPDIQITTTFTNLRDLHQCDVHFSYVLLGPVFNHNYTGSSLYRFSQVDLIKYLSGSNHTVVALGGVSSDRIKFIKELGFKGFVLQSAIWKTVNPISVFQGIAQQDTAYRKAV